MSKSKFEDIKFPVVCMNVDVRAHSLQDALDAAVQLSYLNTTTTLLTCVVSFEWNQYGVTTQYICWYDWKGDDTRRARRPVKNSVMWEDVPRHKGEWGSLEFKA